MPFEFTILLDAVKKIHDSLQAAGHIKAASEINELQKQLNAALLEQRRLADELDKCKKQLDTAQSTGIHYKDGIYLGPNGERFCPTCMDKSHERVHLTEQLDPETFGKFRCSQCGWRSAPL